MLLGVDWLCGCSLCAWGWLTVNVRYFAWGWLTVWLFVTLQSELATGCRSPLGPDAQHGFLRRHVLQWLFPEHWQPDLDQGGTRQRSRAVQQRPDLPGPPSRPHPAPSAQQRLQQPQPSPSPPPQPPADRDRRSGAGGGGGPRHGHPGEQGQEDGEAGAHPAPESAEDARGRCLRGACREASRRQQRVSESRERASDLHVCFLYVCVCVCVCVCVVVVVVFVVWGVDLCVCVCVCVWCFVFVVFCVF